MITGFDLFHITWCNLTHSQNIVGILCLLQRFKKLVEKKKKKGYDCQAAGHEVFPTSECLKREAEKTKCWNETFKLTATIIKSIREWETKIKSFTIRRVESQLIKPCYVAMQSLCMWQLIIYAQDSKLTTVHFLGSKLIVYL